MSDDDLVTIGHYRFVYEAELARLHLDEEGIPAFIADAEIVNMDWLLGNAVGNVKIQVARRDAEAATSVLARKTPAQPEGEVDESSKCLACGTRLAEDATTCLTCGWSYGSSADEEDDQSAAR